MSSGKIFTASAAAVLTVAGATVNESWLIASHIAKAEPCANLRSVKQCAGTEHIPEPTEPQPQQSVGRLSEASTSPTRFNLTQVGAILIAGSVETEVTS